MQRNDDEAWQAIVENYGDRPQVPDEVATSDDLSAAGHTEWPDQSSDQPTDQSSDQATGQAPRSPDEGTWGPGLQGLDEDRFVPPEPPPLPRPSRDRAIAWAGLFGSPAVLLLCLVLGISLPRLVAYGLVAGFVGGFCYLVWQMPRGPRDPYDDGAVV